MKKIKKSHNTEYFAQVGDIVRSNYLKSKGYEEIEGVVKQSWPNGMVITVTSDNSNRDWGSLPAKFINGKNYMFDLIKMKNKI